MTWTLLKSLNNSSAPSLDDKELREYIEGRLFSFTYRRDGSILNVNATVLKSNPAALLLAHGRGKTSLLLERDWLLEAVEIEPAVVVSKIMVRQLGPVTLATVRQHLADRHGIPLDLLNQDARSAMVGHEDVHTHMKLSHKHGETQPTRDVPPADDVAERAAELNDTLECDSCGYRRHVNDAGGRQMHETEDLICHCNQCKDDEEFKYVRVF